MRFSDIFHDRIDLWGVDVLVWDLAPLTGPTLTVRPRRESTLTETPKKTPCVMNRAMTAAPSPEEGDHFKEFNERHRTNTASTDPSQIPKNQINPVWNLPTNPHRFLLSQPGVQTTSCDGGHFWDVRMTSPPWHGPCRPEVPHVSATGMIHTAV